MDFKPLIIINSRKALGDKQAFRSLHKFLTVNEKKMSTRTSLSLSRDTLVDVPEEVIEKISLIVSELKQTQERLVKEEATTTTAPPSSKKRPLDESNKEPKSEKKKKRHKKD